jgi:nucleoside 2-deoxyribosyltransferase
MKSIYLIGSLRNEKIPELANTIEAQGFECFDSWFSPGSDADWHWKQYETARGRSYAEALKSYAGQHVFEFDKHHIDRCDIGVLMMPAGKSGHLELGYMLGTGKPGFILFEEEPERWDVMYQFATGIFFSTEDLLTELRKPEYHD